MRPQPTRPQDEAQLPSAPAHPELVQLDRDHPGFRDRGYRARRNAIAAQARNDTGLGPVPDVLYTAAEHELWRDVSARLAELHARYAVNQARIDRSELGLLGQHAPQMAAINRVLRRRTEFTLRPVAGLVEGHAFLASLASGSFLATQYLRHPSQPDYTPEPDALHEFVGHATLLAEPSYASLHRSFGRAALAAQCPADRQRLDRLYWRTMEFGLVEEGGRPKAIGAGLLSSCGELERIGRDARLEAFDTEAVLEADYDPTTFQPVLYVLPPWEQAMGQLEHILAGFG